MGRQIFIEPVDVWLFRDGRPFTGGEDIRAKSQFPPSPLTLQGAIRSKLLSLSGVDLADEGAVRQEAEKLGIGWDVSDFGSFRLKGPLVAKRDGKGNLQRLLPPPADLVATKEDCELFLAEPAELPSEISVSPLPEGGLLPVWVKSYKPVEPPKGWLTEDSFKRYLRGDISGLDFLKPAEVAARERRTGIRLAGERRTVEEGMLYQAEFVRLREGVGLWAEVEGVELPQRGEILLGGEGKAARFESINPPLSSLDAELREEALSGRWERFKVVLLTPAYFGKGWGPDQGWDKFFGAEVTLKGLALPRPLFIGGHGLVKGEREVRPFVPPGAVYFFEGSPKTLPQGFTESPPNWDEIWKIGFGLYAIGRW